MLIVTGSAGFIGSNLVGKLNHEGIDEILVVDDFSNPAKHLNLEGKKYMEKLHRDFLFDWIEKNHKRIEIIFHIGARTDTAEFDKRIFEKLNLGYTKQTWQLCSDFRIPFIYASSAATYGLGELGYDDSHKIVPGLKPLNPYGESKNDFDKWALLQKDTPPSWYGFKFFNVYGPNEYHKARMASVIFHAYNQIKDTGKMKLFRSHHPDYQDGEQKRDFIYVKDVTDVLFHFMKHQTNSGIYNLGTGKARTFLDLVKGTFSALKKSEKIEYIDTPADIRDKYQYFTEAKMHKLRAAGYEKRFIELEPGIEDYVRYYLESRKYF